MTTLKNRWLTLWASLLAVALPLGCGSGDDPAQGDGDADADSDADGDGDDDSYPPPPYGNLEGDIIENLVFAGPDGEVFDLQDFHADPDARLIMLFATAGWCVVCGIENETLLEWDPTYRGDGLRIIGIVFEDENGLPADAAYADQYFREGYGAEYTVGADPFLDLERYFDKAATPLNMFIRPDTMEIVSMNLGWSEEAYLETIDYWLYQYDFGSDD
jgi:hypothetical protein